MANDLSYEQREQARAALRKAIELSNGQQTTLASRLNDLLQSTGVKFTVSQQLINYWLNDGVISPVCVWALAVISGLPRHHFRPDICPPPISVNKK